MNSALPVPGHSGPRGSGTARGARGTADRPHVIAPAGTTIPRAHTAEPGARRAGGRPHLFLSDLPRLAALAWLAGAFPAGAQDAVPCRETAAVDRMLAGFGQTVQSIGLTSDGQMVQWWGNADTGSWTVVVVHASGASCITLHGTAFEAAAPAVVPGVPG